MYVLVDQVLPVLIEAEPIVKALLPRKSIATLHDFDVAGLLHAAERVVERFFLSLRELIPQEIYIFV
jgi:hypothetical protein